MIRALSTVWKVVKLMVQVMFQFWGGGFCVTCYFYIDMLLKSALDIYIYALGSRGKPIIFHCR